MNLYRPMASLALVATAFSLTGCLQWGEYAMGAECSDFSTRVKDAVAQSYGTDVSIDDMWAGEAPIWCGFDVITGVDLDDGDPHRGEVGNRVRELLDDTFDEGVSVTLVYPDSSDTVGLDPYRR